jgi:hypothetical protein
LPAAAKDNSVSFAGERTALPKRSVPYNNRAGAMSPVVPIAGTLSTVRA